MCMGIDMNKKIAEKIAGYLTEENEETTYIKIVYYLETLFGELEKSMIILFLFSCIGYFTYIAVIMCMLYMLRPFLGGTHCKTYFSCLMYSVGICAMPLLLHHVTKIFLEAGRNNVQGWIPEIIISIGMLLFIILIAPVKSKYRPVYQGKILIQMKIKGVVSLILCNVVFMLAKQLQPFISWMLFILLLDSMIAFFGQQKNFTMEV